MMAKSGRTLLVAAATTIAGCMGADQRTVPAEATSSSSSNPGSGTTTTGGTMAGITVAPISFGFAEACPGCSQPAGGSSSALDVVLSSDPLTNPVTDGFTVLLTSPFRDFGSVHTDTAGSFQLLITLDGVQVFQSPMNLAWMSANHVAYRESADQTQLLAWFSDENPETLPPGSHLFQATVTDQGQTATASLPYDIPVPPLAGDVKIITVGQEPGALLMQVEWADSHGLFQENGLPFVTNYNVQVNGVDVVPNPVGAETYLGDIQIIDRNESASIFLYVGATAASNGSVVVSSSFTDPGCAPGTNCTFSSSASFPAP